MKYSELDIAGREALIQEQHVLGNKSLVQLAEEYGTYPNKLRRDAIKFNLKIRSKSEAQSIALKSGRSKHPTEGTKRPDEVKVKISEQRSEAWKNVSEEEKQKISERTKEQWNAMTPEERDNFRRKAAKAVRQAAFDGSKLERHIMTKLTEAGYMVEFHKEHVLQNERLQLDLFLPTIGVAIEVDGPSHFAPIWGNKTLQKNKRADSEKNGLLINRGFTVIRVIQDGPLSEKYKRDKANALLALINKCVTKQTTDKYFEI